MHTHRHMYTNTHQHSIKYSNNNSNNDQIHGKQHQMTFCENISKMQCIEMVQSNGFQIEIQAHTTAIALSLLEDAKTPHLSIDIFVYVFTNHWMKKATVTKTSPMKNFISDQNFGS